MTRRVQRVQARMQAEELDFYVASCPDNVYYLTHFAYVVQERPFVLVIPAEGVPSFVVPKLELPHSQARIVGQIDRAPYYEFPAPPGQGYENSIKALIPSSARVGFESVGQLQIWQATPGDKQVIDIVEEVRFVKSDYEIGRLTWAGALISQGHQMILEMAAVGVTVLDVHKEVSGWLGQQIFAAMPQANPVDCTPAAIFQGPDICHNPHNFTDLSSMVMQPGGPHVSLITGQYNGCGVEVERTFFLGSVPEYARKPFAVQLEARARAFELCRPGNSMHDVDAAVRKVIFDAGYSEDNILHRTGHSFGMTGHEAPFLAEGYDRIIEPGMLFSIEPGIYLEPGRGGYRFSDTVLVTESGNVSLTNAPETLDELTLGGRHE
jgi:Xaa-Pro dipeptidase